MFVLIVQFFQLSLFIFTDNKVNVKNRFAFLREKKLQQQQQKVVFIT